MNRHRMIAGLGVVVLAFAACTGGGSQTASTTTTKARASTTTTTTSAIGPPTITDETLTTADGRTRTYRVVVPGSVDAAEPVPLLVALHGGTGSGQQFERSSGFDDLAAAHGFIVVYPDGIEIGGPSSLAKGHVWNGGKCCGRAAREGVDDVAFVAALIDRVEDTHRIDAQRVYATGHSNGAIMSYRLACQLSDRIVAIGVQAGAIEVDDCAPGIPVSVISIHGTADTNIPIDGGQGTGLSAVPFSSPTDAVATFAALNRCDASATRESAANADVSIETWTPCAARTEVQFVRVAGASHAWMGTQQLRRPTLQAVDYDSSAAIWDFLAAHPRVP